MSGSGPGSELRSESAGTAPAFILSCVRSGGVLALTEPATESFRAALQAQQLSASGLVHHLAGGESFRDFWAELATNWRGWSGQIRWASYERQLSLIAEADRLGHVSFVAELVYVAELAGSTELGWAARVRILLEAGQLEPIARQARVFEAAVLGAA